MGDFEKETCAFFTKIGSCRHGETCNKTHVKPPFSQTVLIKGIYYSPMIPIVNEGKDVEKELDVKMYQLTVDDIYEEIVEEVSKFGQLEDVQLLENLNDHMIGSAYIKYADEEHAEACRDSMNQRFYAGRTLKAEFSPVIDFPEGRCRVYDDGGECNRGAYCNFMHIATPSSALRNHVNAKYGFRTCVKGTGSLQTISMRNQTNHMDYRRNRRSRSRSPDDRRRDRSRSRDRETSTHEKRETRSSRRR
jgi:splicing factor U2AF 35 kDa subunit